MVCIIYKDYFFAFVLILFFVTYVSVRYDENDDCEDSVVTARPHVMRWWGAVTVLLTQQK